MPVPAVTGTACPGEAQIAAGSVELVALRLARPAAAACSVADHSQLLVHLEQVAAEVAAAARCWAGWAEHAGLPASCDAVRRLENTRSHVASARDAAADDLGTLRAGYPDPPGGYYTAGHHQLVSAARQAAKAVRQGLGQAVFGDLSPAGHAGYGAYLLAAATSMAAAFRSEVRNLEAAYTPLRAVLAGAAAAGYVHDAAAEMTPARRALMMFRIRLGEAMRGF